MDSTVVAGAVLEERRQVEEILQSETFRGSEVLRHLFRFLAERTFAGDADSLKEYTIAIDALGRASTYNPQHDSTVRIQVSRLRLKLAEYSRTEGRDAPFVVDIPKGRFKVTFEARNPQPFVPASPPADAAPIQTKRSWLIDHVALGSLGFLLVITTVRCLYLQYRLNRSETSSTVHLSHSPDVQKLWTPILDNKRPLILGIEDPLFLQFPVGDGIYYRDRKIDDWSQLSRDPSVAQIRQILNYPAPIPDHYYSTFGEVSVAFIIGRLTARSQQHVSVVKASQLSWEDMADNNILIVGKHNFFDSELRAMPLHPELFTSDQGVENPNPRPGEPRIFTDSYSSNTTQDGEVYALVSRLPGAAGKGDFISFLSNRAAGYVGALKWFTDPQFASMITPKLTDASGKVARHYQVVLKVKFRDGVPTEITYVLGRQLP